MLTRWKGFAASSSFFSTFLCLSSLVLDLTAGMLWAVDIVHDDHWGKHGDDGEVGEDGAGHQAVVGVRGLHLLTAGTTFHRGEVSQGLFVQLHTSVGGWLEFGELGKVVEHQGGADRSNSWDTHNWRIDVAGAGCSIIYSLITFLWWMLKEG